MCLGCKISEANTCFEGRTFLSTHTSIIRGNHHVGHIPTRRAFHYTSLNITFHAPIPLLSHRFLSAAVLSSFFSIHYSQHDSFQQIADTANIGADLVFTFLCSRTVELVARAVQSHRQSRVPAGPKLQGISKRPGLWVRS
jgi:hypothetical protein